MKQLLSFCIVSVLFVFSACDNSSGTSDNNLPDNGYVELTYPLGGNSFTVGETVIIKFKVNKSTISGIVPQISINNGLTWNAISNSIAPDPNGEKGQLLTCSWIIGQEKTVPPYDATNAQCLIMVQDYTINEAIDQSTVFTITK